MAEARRAAVRIGANYVRLFATVILGLYLVRVLLSTVGEEVYGLISLLTSTIGIVTVVEEAASWSMIRELGAAHHSGDASAFRRMFNSAVVVSAGAAALMLVVFAIILACLPLLNIPPDLLPAARWYVIAMAIMSSMMVLVSPQFNMYLVAERMVAYNFWLVTRRLTMLLGAVALWWLNPADAAGGPARGLVLYGWLFCALQCLGMGISVAIIMWQDRRLIPAPSMATRDGAKAIIAISGWNVGIQTSQMLALPGGAVIMNLAFGLVYGNVLFGLAVTLAGYARMFASGMTMGLDAVAARLSTTSDDHSMRRLVQTSTFLHGLAAFPAVAGIGVLALPFLNVWVGTKIDDPAHTLPLVASLTRVLLIGFLVMCIGDGWTRILFGAGFVKRYGPAVIWSNVITPLVTVVILWSLPQPYKFTAAAWGFSLAYFAAQAVIVPRIVASSFGMRWMEVYSPLARLAVIAIACVPLVAAFHWFVPQWNLGWLTLAAIPYGLAYTCLVWFWAVNGEERTRLRRAGLRMLPGRAGESKAAATG